MDMCTQTAVFMLLIAGLVFLLLCFVPTWIICILGVALIAAGVVQLIIRLKRGR